jgi:hypothetical protein
MHALALGMVITVADLVRCTDSLDDCVLNPHSHGLTPPKQFRYVSFFEIFASKAVSGFLAAGYTEDESCRYATLCFFCGMLAIWLLDKLVHLILKFASHGMRALDIMRLKKKVRWLLL